MSIGAVDLEAMTPEQRSVHDAIASGPRGGVPRPFLAMLDAPELADAIQAVGSALRFSGALPADLREVAILSSAAAYGSGYEWDYHEPITRQLGVTDAVIAAARAGREDQAGSREAADIIRFCWSAIRERQADHEALSRLTEAVGRRGATEVVAIAGYYPVLALFLSAASLDHDVPKGETGIDEVDSHP